LSCHHSVKPHPGRSGGSGGVLTHKGLSGLQDAGQYSRSRDESTNTTSPAPVSRTAAS
jgi:hypothetical protein